MTAREWDSFWKWIGKSRTRTISAIWAALMFIIGACALMDNASSTGRDHACDRSEIGHVVDGVLCQQVDGWPTLVHSAQWDLGVFKTWIILAIAGCILPIGNFLLLGSRSYISAASHKWRASATKQVLTERAGRLRAEALSRKADEEYERVSRELEELKNRPVREFA